MAVVLEVEAAKMPPEQEPTTDMCHGAVWRHERWWYVTEVHQCDLGSGRWLISHHRTQAEAQAAAEARYPRAHELPV